MNLTEYAFAGRDRWPSDRADAPARPGRPDAGPEPRPVAPARSCGCGTACPSRSARRCCPSWWPGSWCWARSAWPTSSWTAPTRPTPGVAGPGAPGPARLGRRLVRDASPASATGRSGTSRCASSRPSRCSPTRWPGSRAWRRPRARARWPTRPPWPPPPCSTSWSGASPAQAALARRAVWILSLLPAAFVLVMGYAESVLLVLGRRLLPGPAPAARRAPTPGPHFAVAGVLAFAGRPDPAHRGAPGPGRRWPSWSAGGRGSGAPSGSAGIGAVGGALRRPARLRGLGRPHGGRLVGPAAGPAPERPPRRADRSLHRRCSTTPRACCTTTSARPCTCPGCCWPWPCSSSAGAACPPPTPCSPPAVLAVAVSGLQPRFLRALRPERLPAVHGRRPGPAPSRSSSGPC